MLHADQPVAGVELEHGQILAFAGDQQAEVAQGHFGDVDAVQTQPGTLHPVGQRLHARARQHRAVGHRRAAAVGIVGQGEGVHH
ncbi:hypothetical protein D3C75_787410 [compost metagenome]